jgi:hypothetical protein
MMLKEKNAKITHHDAAPAPDGTLYREIKVYQDQNVSWKRCVGGGAILRLSTHTGNPYLGFDVEEFYTADGGRVVSRRVMMTMDKEDAAAVVAWIKDAFSL